ncbi:MAG: hypothetical protein ACLFN0_09300 [Thermovirgaceae bacterium]
MGTKKRIFLFSVFLALAVGVAVSLYGTLAKTDGDELFSGTQPVEKTFIEEAVQVEPSFVDVSEDLKAPEESSGDILSDAEPEEEGLAEGITSVGTGKPFDEVDLEWVRLRSPGGQVVSQDKEKNIMDSLDPGVRKVIEETGEVVEEIDEKTLEVTSEILDAVPFLNLKPEKAEIRPGGGGAKLTIELSPEALGIGKKQDKAQTEPASSDVTSPDQGQESD